jgi:hypothetical protein
MKYLLLGLLFFCNCISSQFGIPSGTMIQNQGKLLISANSYNPYDKIGDACAKSYFGLFAIGDASIERAALRGNITQISSVTQEAKWQLFYFQEYCIVVRGK